MHFQKYFDNSENGRKHVYFWQGVQYPINEQNWKKSGHKNVILPIFC